MKAEGRKGFTLIEVCLVMMIFGIAVSSLMALFPVSLRQGSQAVSDSVVTTFGDAVINAIAGRASSLQERGDWNTWKNEASFKTKVLSGLGVYNGSKDSLGTGEHVIDDYLSEGKKTKVTIKYKLEIDTVDTKIYGKRLYRAILHVTDNKYASVEEAGAVFVTYMFYFGEVEEEEQNENRQ